MENLIRNFTEKCRSVTRRFSVLEWLGIVIGIIMPVISALVYPTYVNSMQTAWVEWSRLLEAPFVICEMLIILWAGRKGMDSTKMWRSLPPDIKIASMFLILGVFASSLFASEFPLKSIMISEITVVHLLFGLSIYHLLRISNTRDFQPFLILIGAGLISLAILTIWWFAFPPPAALVPGGVIEWPSALPGFINVRHFGSWTGAIATGLLVRLLYTSEKVRCEPLTALYFLSAVMTVWSGTRAAILAMAVTLLILIAAHRKIPRMQAIGAAALLTGAALTVAWLLLPYNDPTFLLFDPSDGTSANALTSGRIELWAATFEKWQTAPLFGLGSGSTFWEVYVGWPHTQPHNAVLQFLISWGLVGAVPALWMLGRAITRAHIVTMRTTSLMPFLAILYALLIMSMLEGMLHYPRFIMLIMLILAAIMASDSNETEAATTS